MARLTTSLLTLLTANMALTKEFLVAEIRDLEQEIQKLLAEREVEYLDKG